MVEAAPGATMPEIERPFAPVGAYDAGAAESRAGVHRYAASASCGTGRIVKEQGSCADNRSPGVSVRSREIHDATVGAIHCSHCGI